MIYFALLQEGLIVVGTSFNRIIVLMHYSSFVGIGI